MIGQGIVNIGLYLDNGRRNIAWEEKTGFLTGEKDQKGEGKGGPGWGLGERETYLD